MINYFLVQNRQGKTRVSKWYTPYEDEEKRKISSEVHRVVNKRESRFSPRDALKYTNFVEYRNHKLVYRRYAGLFFCMAVDNDDNELYYLEAIHLFVEVLDAYFGNVCELDLVFNFHKVYMVIDEVFLAGEIMETSKLLILNQIAQQGKLE
eukprot:TRINITY_DN13370_c0_g1_i1.p1 TRINITY_DN13370_c0_g1~~TRINITY_DN13370_c0_g1_i1.p1  ORF type:complete len:151 (+),score=40.03 TRINITY_DN13370_c0_g1_i1:274-726(+)